MCLMGFAVMNPSLPLFLDGPSDSTKKNVGAVCQDQIVNCTPLKCKSCRATRDSAIVSCQCRFRAIYRVPGRYKKLLYCTRFKSRRF
eukprot:g15329.t1